MPRTPFRRPSAQVVLSVVGALVGLVVALGFYRASGNDASAPSQLRGYVVDSDQQVTVEFELARAPGKAATCAIRARGADGNEVGRRQFDVPAARERTVVLREPLATTARAVTGEIVGCRLGSAADASPSP